MWRLISVSKKQKNASIYLIEIHIFNFFKLENAPQLAWGLGFIGGPTQQEGEEANPREEWSGYHSAVTEIITDSEDDLYFLDGELATYGQCK